MATETRKNRDACLEVAALHVEKALPGAQGSVQFNLKDGHVANMNITENKRREKPTDEPK